MEKESLNGGGRDVGQDDKSERQRRMSTTSFVIVVSMAAAQILAAVFFYQIQLWTASHTDAAKMRMALQNETKNLDILGMKSSENVGPDKMDDVKFPASNRLSAADKTDFSNTAEKSTKKTAPDSMYAASPDQRGMSACLIIKDDNNRLIEWLAYHYLMLPLRHLVVAVDDDSKTSPLPIFNRWTDPSVVGTDDVMEIVTWSDKDYFTSDTNRIEEGHDRLKARQNYFFASCARHHQSQNRTWMAILDTDEYLAFNYILHDDPKTKFKKNEKKIEEENLKKDPNYLSWRMARLKARIEQLPKTAFGKTAMDVIEENSHLPPWIDEPCIAMPRLYHSAVESNDEILEKAGAGQVGFNATKFNTLRFFHHAKKGEFQFNQWTKPIIDLSRVPKSQLALAHGPHRPFTACTRAFARYEESVLRVNHYLGSWEEYSARDDVRRTRESFDTKSSVNAGATYDLQPWLTQFVKRIGYDAAHRLLEGVGELQTWN